VTVQDLFARLASALHVAGVPYMLTGSYASSVHGIPRATRDVDIIIFPTREQLIRLVEQLPAASYYADLEDALDALRRRTQFNVIDHATGWKVDFIIPPFSEFNIEEFERRRTVEIEGSTLFVASPEDIVVAKLQWAKAGSSERQLDDAASVLRAQGSTLDLPYVERWVRKLGVEEQWRAVREKAS
jgi:hypothetical protein